MNTIEGVIMNNELKIEMKSILSMTGSGFCCWWGSKEEAHNAKKSIEVQNK